MSKREVQVWFDSGVNTQDIVGMALDEENSVPERYVGTDYITFSIPTQSPEVKIVLSFENGESISFSIFPKVNLNGDPKIVVNPNDSGVRDKVYITWYQ